MFWVDEISNHDVNYLELNDNGRWYKTYTSSDMKRVAGEIMITNLPKIPGIVSSRLEYCKLSSNCASIRVSTINYPTLVEGKLISYKDCFNLFRALAILESYGLMHGDIKPGNLVLTPDGVSLIDFSLVTHINDWGAKTQGYKNESAIFHDQNIIQRLDPVKSAIFALYITLQHITLLETDFSKCSTFREVCSVVGAINNYLVLPLAEFDEREFIQIDRNIVSVLYNKMNNVFDLYVCLRLILLGYDGIDMFNMRECSEKSIHCLNDWITLYPKCTGKFLSLGFASLVQDGLWKSCQRMENWKGIIDDELKHYKIAKIAVSTETMNFSSVR